MPSQHHQTRKLIRRGIFDDVRSFRDLEHRIGQQPTMKDVGDAFEIFVEGYLATQKLMQAEKVWLVGQIPLEIRGKMNLPANTKGVDGLFRTLLGELVPYQVKFRCAREPLTYTEVASFLGLTERARDRVIFTNASDVARDAKTRDAIRTVRAQDFNRLTQDDFLVIESWLKHKHVQPPKRVPRPYQKKAIDRILSTFRGIDRATAVMACGTGKTLVALWVAEAMPLRRVIVFVPSLALLSQTLKEWSRWTSWGHKYQFLCVCSDPTVSQGIDELRLNQIDTDFPIDTDPAQVRRFLRSNDKQIQVIFSTYQSAPVIMKGAKGLGPFDLAILDEAHKTAGLQGSVFALPLLDDKIRVKKRLFLTATPRHYDISHRDREGDFRVISMDNQALYGPVAYRLTFAEAAKKGIICNYKVVVSVVDGKEVTEFTLAHGITLVDKNEIAVRWVAHQLALRKAIQRVRGTRVITFHSTVRLAQRFASSNVEGIASHLDGFSVYHVNGEQPSAQREDQLDAFREAKRGIVTNARCLTEGVDVPAVDMIAFMNPRKSSVDIAQATGRAMRKAGPEKTMGYVVVPLFLNQHRRESLEEALERSDFEDVANVLNAMQEQDTDLVDIIREMREARGRLGRFNPKRLDEKVQVIGPRIYLARLKANISVRIVDRLGLNWEESYGKLLRFRKRFGNCNVPAKWENDKSLGMWVSTQRTQKMRDQISQDRMQRLAEIGFDWDPVSSQWEALYKKLVAFKKQHGHCNVSRKGREVEPFESWVATQRVFKKKGQLSPERVQKLDALGFDWDPISTRWQAMHDKLIAYKQRFGDCNVPAIWQDDPSLGMWVSGQREEREKKRLSPERIRQLEVLGFSWRVGRSLPWTEWSALFTKLTAYKQRFGDCNVPANWQEDPSLGRWVAKQRGAKTRNHLLPERVRLLEHLGIEWRPQTSAWETMFDQLLRYKQQHGDCNVPSHSKHNRILARWVGKQRRKKKERQLSLKRIRRLNNLNFEWDKDFRKDQWEAMYAKLTAYKKNHNDCNVPARWKRDSSLGRWVSVQRQFRVNDRLTPEHIRQLDALGFNWDPISAQWAEMFKRLAAYKKQYGHCNVPHLWEQDRSLGGWVFKQRQSSAKGRLSPERIRRLSALGFAWRIRQGRQR